MSEYIFILLVILFAIIAMFLFMYIGNVESQVDELEKLVFDLGRLDAEQNDKIFKHMIDIVDKAIENLDKLVEGEE